MKIVFIAPLPPPVTGQSLVSDVLMSGLKPNHDIVLVNLSKDSLVSGVNHYSRYIEIWHVFREVLKHKKKADIIYLTISASVPGNLRDLLVYLICFRKLNRMIIHLHGGSFGKLLFDKYPLLKRVNKIFIKRMKGVIVLGESHVSAVDGMIDRKKVHILPNFAFDNLFLSDEQIRNKYKGDTLLRVLFLSHLIDGKGYLDLLNGYKQLDKDLQDKIQLDFAGGFFTPTDQQSFLAEIKSLPNVKYHGIVGGELKQQLLQEAHVLCLPTKYFEGQPLAILEAYASGCSVVTTEKPGIMDIFTPIQNGFLVEQNSPESIKACLTKLVLNEHKRLEEIGVWNNRIAREKYTLKQFISSSSEIFIH